MINNQYIFLGWIYDPDPVAAAQGCGHTFTEIIPAPNQDTAILALLEKHPTVQLDGMRIICKELGVDIRYTPKPLPQARRWSN